MGTWTAQPPAPPPPPGTAPGAPECCNGPPTPPAPRPTARPGRAHARRAAQASSALRFGDGGQPNSPDARRAEGAARLEHGVCKCVQVRANGRKWAQEGARGRERGRKAAAGSPAAPDDVCQRVDKEKEKKKKQVLVRQTRVRQREREREGRARGSERAAPWGPCPRLHAPAASESNRVVGDRPRRATRTSCRPELFAGHLPRTKSEKKKEASRRSGADDRGGIWTSKFTV